MTESMAGDGTTGAVKTHAGESLFALISAVATRFGGYALPLYTVAFSSSQLVTSDNADSDPFKPDTHTGDGGPGGQKSDLDNELQDLHFVTQDTRSSIIQTILGHPKKSPSVSEIQYMLPKSSGSIGEQLDKLQERGLVERIIIPKGERTRSGPNTFYVLSRQGWELLNQHGVFTDRIDRLEEGYSNVTKSDKIKQYEEYDRPSEVKEYVALITKSRAENSDG